VEENINIIIMDEHGQHPTGEQDWTVTVG